MTSIAIKNKLIESIKKIENDELLIEVQNLLDIEIQSNPEISLSKEVINSISIGRDQKKSGMIISHQEANNQVEKWLKEQ